jgi:type IV pilus assembly protein PilB
MLRDAVGMGYIHSYVNKPWEPEEVRAAIRDGIQAYEALQEQKASRKMIGQILLEHDIIDETQLEKALETQELGRRKLGEILVDLGFADEESIFSCYALQLGIPYISLSQFPKRRDIAELLPSQLARKYGVVPIDKTGRVLVVATSEPLGDRVRTRIEQETGYKVSTVCASYRDIESALEEYYPDAGTRQSEPGSD